MLWYTVYYVDLRCLAHCLLNLNTSRNAIFSGRSLKRYLKTLCWKSGRIKKDNRFCSLDELLFYLIETFKNNMRFSKFLKKKNKHTLFVCKRWELKWSHTHRLHIGLTWNYRMERQTKRGRTRFEKRTEKQKSLRANHLLIRLS